MRNENEMMRLISSFAENDDRIRAAYMNGSRTNPNVEKDAFRDYDVVFSVAETAPFIADKSWLNYFGKIAVMQEPDKNDCDCSAGADCDFLTSYCYLVLYNDGNRIDFHVEAAASTTAVYGTDSLTLPLLDKDGILRPVAPPDESSYFIVPPSEAEFRACCNEFWWCMNNAAKGKARDQLSYTMWMFNTIEHDMLCKMLDWYIGSRHQNGITTGAHGKYYKKLLPADMYRQLESSYVDFERFWDGVFSCCGLFSRAARAVAEKYRFEYVRSEEDNMLAYLRSMQSL